MSRRGPLIKARSGRRKVDPAHLWDVEVRAWVQRWSNKGLADVTHPAHGTVTVPCGSKLSALEFAAELWGCDWLAIRDAKVTMARPGATAVMPEELLYYQRSGT